MKTPKHMKNIVSTKDIVGVNVKNPQGQDLGEIQEIVLEKVSGKVAYLVLSFGGILGINNKYFAIPWKAIHYDPVKDVFVLDISKEKLKDAPGFDKDQPPNFSDPLWSKSIDTFYE